MTARVELLHKSDLHLLRKLWHIMTGLLGLSLYYLLPITSQEMGFGLMVFGGSTLAFDVMRLNIKPLNNLSLALFGPFMRESEKSSLSGLPF